MILASGGGKTYSREPHVRTLNHLRFFPIMDNVHLYPRLFTAPRLTYSRSIALALGSKYNFFHPRGKRQTPSCRDIYPNPICIVRFWFQLSGPFVQLTCLPHGNLKIIQKQVQTIPNPIERIPKHLHPHPAPNLMQSSQSQTYRPRRPLFSDPSQIPSHPLVQVRLPLQTRHLQSQGALNTPHLVPPHIPLRGRKITYPASLLPHLPPPLGVGLKNSEVNNPATYIHWTMSLLPSSSSILHHPA